MAIFMILVGCISALWGVNCVLVQAVGEGEAFNFIEKTQVTRTISAFVSVKLGLNAFEAIIASPFT